MTASVTYIGPSAHDERTCKTAGQLAYEAAGDWIAEYDAASNAPPTWDTLDARARAYWDRIGASVRAPMIESLREMLAAAGTSSARSIRGLWVTP